MAQQNFYPSSVLLDTSRETLYNIAMSHRSHCNWRPTLWLYFTDGVTIPRHAQHCDWQCLILDSYRASFKFLYHVVRMRVLTSNYHIANDTWPDAHYRIAVRASPDAHCVIALWRRIGFVMELLVTGKISEGRVTRSFQWVPQPYTYTCQKECNDVAVCRAWRNGPSAMVCKSPKTRHGMSCCCARSYLWLEPQWKRVPDELYVTWRTILNGLDIRSSRLWWQGEGTSWIGPLSQPCTSPRTCNELGEVCSFPSYCKGPEKPLHDATWSL